MRAKYTVILLAVCLGFALPLTAKDKKPRPITHPKDVKTQADYVSDAGALATAIKGGLIEPERFRLLRAFVSSYVSLKGYPAHYVCISYGGPNAYGGMVEGRASGIFYYDGTGSRHSSIWHWQPDAFNYWDNCSEPTWSGGNKLHVAADITVEVQSFINDPTAYIAAHVGDNQPLFKDESQPTEQGVVSGENKPIPPWQEVWQRENRTNYVAEFNKDIAGTNPEVHATVEGTRFRIHSPRASQQGGDLLLQKEQFLSPLVNTGFTEFVLTNDSDKTFKWDVKKNTQ